MFGDLRLMSHQSQYCRGPRDNPFLHKHPRSLPGPSDYRRRNISSPQKTNKQPNQPMKQQQTNKQTASGSGSSSLTNTSITSYENILLHQFCPQSLACTMNGIFQDFSFHIGKIAFYMYLLVGALIHEHYTILLLPIPHHTGLLTDA